MINPVSPSINERRITLITAFGWVLLCAVVVIVYCPGLNGPFLFDDYGSIADLGNFGGVTNWENFKIFVLGGHSGPTGRPIALLSFLIDGHDWPTDPWPFKRTNLAIHLLNGVLLGVLISKILQLLDFSRRDSNWIAFFSAACWLLHPFLVSTTLYAVQRMAQLSTLFILAGLYVHLIGRSKIPDTPFTGYSIMTLSVGGFTLLAVFSKENGILLPLLIGVIEFTVIASRRERLQSLDRRWLGLFIAFPSAIIFLYLLSRTVGGHFFEIVPPRDFSVYERLLTQPRVLLDYLRHWFIPELYTTGVFQDHFIKSTGLFSPVSTALSALIHAVVIAAAVIYRRKLPLFALAALFFYAGHLIESTVLNLELYFEHRNYLSAAFLLLPLVASLRVAVSRRKAWIVMVAVLTLLGGFTRYSATIWQDFSSIVEASAQKAPTSSRAQAQYATQLFNNGHHEQALTVITTAIENTHSQEPLLWVNRLIILCNMGADMRRDFQDTSAVLSNRPYDPRALQMYTEISSLVVTGKCQNVEAESLRALFSGMLQVPDNANPSTLVYSQLQYLLGYSQLYTEELPAAVRAFRASLTSRPGAQHAMIMAALLATEGYFDKAIEFSEMALTQLDVAQSDLLVVSRVTREDILHFQSVVRADQATIEMSVQ